MSSEDNYKADSRWNGYIILHVERPSRSYLMKWGRQIESSDMWGLGAPRTYTWGGRRWMLWKDKRKKPELLTMGCERVEATS